MLKVLARRGHWQAQYWYKRTQMLRELGLRVPADGPSLLKREETRWNSRSAAKLKQLPYGFSGAAKQEFIPENYGALSYGISSEFLEAGSGSVEPGQLRSR